MAIINGNETAVDILWRRQADHTVVDNDGNSLLHLACKGTSQSIVAQLLKFTADINARNKESETALHIACKKGYFDICKILLKNFPDVEKVDVVIK